MKVLINKKSITSLELLEQINMFREQEKKSKMRHFDLLKIIEKEFREEINERKISFIEYTDSRQRKQKAYNLTFSQAKQVLLKESSTVRKAVIKYIEKLENTIIQLQEQKITEARYLGKITRKLETDSIKGLMAYGRIEPRNQWKYYKHYTNLAYSVMGYNPKNKPKREEMAQGELIILDKLENVINMEISNNIALGTPFILIYQNVKDKLDKVYREMKNIFILEQKNNNNLMLQ